MRLAKPEAAQGVEVVFPDVSGESFVRQWVDRVWRDSYERLVDSTSGVLVFVHPERLESGTRIDQAASILAELELSGPGGLSGTDETTGESQVSDDHADAGHTEPWDPEHSPTQVVLVDLLQNLLDRHPSRTGLPVAVIISAWDLVQNEEIGPKDWLFEHMPLLVQYLDSNPEELPWRAYGVSAQGGDVRNAGEAARLRRIHNPELRIIVVGEGVTSPNDITSPLRWLLEQEHRSREA
jgi:hypothetical protein